MLLKSQILDRFLKYVRVNTRSDRDSADYPSTDHQLILLRMLAEELKVIGASHVRMDKYGYVTATIPATVSDASRIPVIAFIAHVDTSPDLSGSNVNPRVVKYSGGGITINAGLGVVLSEEELTRYVGHELVVTDGTTLLGADDKAGIAEIMTALQYLIEHPEVPHGIIKVAFTPDEEIGRGVEYFDVAAFGADYAYTVDGGRLGSIEYETFNAAEAKITIHGVNTHPGYAKGIMVNSQLAAIELINELPAAERPELTSGREGFFHLAKICGTTDQTVMEYIIRDHDHLKFEGRKRIMREAAARISARHGITIDTDIVDQYGNMREMIEPHFQIVEIAGEAMRQAGIEPVVEPVRGGTDGSSLSFMGLPCPNLFSGAENMHSRKEFVSLEVMCKSAETIINICKLFYYKTLDNR